jgi:hypothetical protein
MKNQEGEEQTAVAGIRICDQGDRVIEIRNHLSVFSHIIQVGNSQISMSKL